MLLAAYELDPEPRRDAGCAAWRSSSSPRSPFSRRRTAPSQTVRYYHLLLVDPPFAGRVTEWRWSEPEVKTIAFYVLAVIAVVVVWRGRRRLVPFDIARARSSRSPVPSRDPRNRVVRAGMHGVRPRRDRPTSSRARIPASRGEGSTWPSQPA